MFVFFACSCCLIVVKTDRLLCDHDAAIHEVFAVDSSLFVDRWGDHGLPIVGKQWMNLHSGRSRCGTQQANEAVFRSICPQA